MEELDVEGDEATEEIMPLRSNNPRRQRQKLQFAEEEEKPERSSVPFKPPGRASRFLSICDPSLQLPGESLFKLRQLHSQTMNNVDSLAPEEITDELLDTMPFKIEIIPDRRDNLDMDESPLRKSREKNLSANNESMQIPAVVPSGLSEARRLEIIEEILKNLSQKNILDETRRANAISFRLPTKTQMQKNVAERIRDLTGSEIIMLNDQVYMKHLCQLLAEKHQKELEANFERLSSTEKHRQLFENFLNSH